MLKLHLLPSKAEMSPTPGSSHSVKRKQNTSTSPLTLYWGENKMNMEIQVGNLVKTLHVCNKQLYILLNKQIGTEILGSKS